MSAVEEGDEPAVSLSLHSPHGDEGYPGNLDVTVTYRLRSGGAFEICFESACDRATILNLINHVAFQLGGLSEENIRTHRLWLDADGYLPVRDLIPTGAILPVEGTIFDFRSPKPLGQDLDAPLLQKTKGYDVCLRFTEREGGGLLHRATLYHESSGREMQMYTDLPAMQLYCGNYYGDPERPFKGGIPQRIHHGVCLEAGMMPDSPNHPGFTDATLSPGEKLEHKIIFQFSVN